MAEPDGTREHSHPGLNIGSTVTDAIDVADELFEIAEREVFEDEVEVLIAGREDGQQGDNVWMLKFLKELEFANGVRWHALGIFFLNLDLLDGNELGGVATDMAKEHKGVGTLSELLACQKSSQTLCVSQTGDTFSIYL